MDRDGPRHIAAALLISLKNQCFLNKWATRAKGKKPIEGANATHKCKQVAHARTKMGGAGAAKPNQCNPNRFAAPDPAEESQAKLRCAAACQAKKAQDGSKTTLPHRPLHFLPHRGRCQIWYGFEWINDHVALYVAMWLYGYVAVWLCG